MVREGRRAAGAEGAICEGSVLCCSGVLQLLYHVRVLLNPQRPLGYTDPWCRLLFMTYNGWVMLAVAVGAFLGYLGFGGSTSTKSVACH